MDDKNFPVIVKMSGYPRALVKLQLAERVETALSLEQVLEETIIIDGEEFISIGGIIKKIKSFLPTKKEIKKATKTVGNTAATVKKAAKTIVREVDERIDDIKEVVSDEQKDEKKKGMRKEGEEGTGEGGPGGSGKENKGNPCHDAKGRFCETPDKVKWPAKGGREIKKLSGKSNVEINLGDGPETRRVHSVWEVTSKDGTKLQLFDVDGKSKDEDKKIWLDALARNYEQHPISPPPTLVTQNIPEAPDPKTTEDDWMGMVAQGLPYVFLNTRDVIEGNKGGKGDWDEPYGDRGHMPSTKAARMGDYVVAHEYGHIINFASKENGGTDQSSNALVEYMKPYASIYGNFAPAEGFAEAYAEWHVSRGTTSNLAAKAYASWERWPGWENIELHKTSGAKGI